MKEGSSRSSNPDWNGRPDAISMELIMNSLSGICEEMADALVRSSRSPNIKERRDCSCCLYTAKGEIVAQAEHIPIHLGVMAGALHFILEDFSPAAMHQGDVYMVNDPYHGANHLPDFIIVGPLFVDGVLVGFAASMAHHTDVGGMSPRSMPANATEIFQEGLRIPPIRLVEEGRLNEAVERIIVTNSRLPEERRADLKAQIATIAVAQRRLHEMGTLYGPDEIVVTMNDVLERSEAAMRAAIRALPQQRYCGTASADFGGTAVPIAVAVEPKGDTLQIDFSATGNQTLSPFNSCMAATLACVFMATRITIANGLPVNAGLYRAIDVQVPPGSILNPNFPAAISAAAQVSYHTFEALMAALAALYPNQVIAGSGGGGVFSFGGTNPETGRLFAYGEALGGGSGASVSADGESGMIPPIANLHDTPVEALEMSLPVRIERYELVEDSGGLGEFRGGFGLRRAFRMLTDVRCSFQVSMPTNGPMGLAGGQRGRQTEIVITDPSGNTRRIDRFSEVFVSAGTLINIETAGGGGYGEAARRSPQAQLDDERRGYGFPHRSAEVSA
jgi:N-methylhydantoinase B